MLSPSSKNHKIEKISSKETTVNNLLLEAMNNLELSTKKKRLNQSMANSSINAKTPQTGDKRITRSMKASLNYENTSIETSSNVKLNESKIETPRKKISKNILHQISKIECVTTTIITENEETPDLEKIDMLDDSKLLPDRDVTSFNLDKPNDLKEPTKVNYENIKEQEENSVIVKSAEESCSDHNSIQDGIIEQQTQENEEIDAVFIDSKLPVKLVSDDSKQQKLKKPQIVTSLKTKITFESKYDQCISLENVNEQQSMQAIDSEANSSKLLPGKIVTSFNLGKPKELKEPKKIINVPLKKRPHVIATSIRRKSLLKPKDPFKSIAESVSKFHKETPKRFHSVPAKNAKPVTTKQTALKITRPVSPVLTSKNRVRPIKTNDKKENVELKKIRNGPVKADPKAISTLQSTRTKTITKKPVKVFDNFESSKKGHFSSSESLSTQHNSASCSNHDSQHPKLDHSVHKKVVPTIVSTDDAKLAVKEVEIGHFGIPTDTSHKPKKITRALPFSFETRNKELQEKKELRMKKLQLQEMEKNKKESQVKPVPNTKEPSYLKRKVTPLKNPKETLSAKKTTPRPFSFEQRDKQLLKKKEDLIKEAYEKEKKGREFHANPVPEFRQVIVRGRSKENLKLDEKTPHEEGKTKKPSSASKACVIKRDLFPPMKNENQENKEPKNQVRSNSASSINIEKMNFNKKATILGELNTDKRARDRKLFLDRLRRKELEDGAVRKKEEEERLQREKAEIAELRKMTETKARPVPHYKPMAVIKSKKALTDPQSPAWAHKHKI